MSRIAWSNFASRGTKLILVTYKQNASQSSILKVIERLVAQGTREVAIPAKPREEPNWMNGLIQLHRKAQPERYVSVRDLEDLDPLGSNGWPLPRVTLLDHSHVGKDFPKELLLVERPLHLILLPEGLRDPRNPGRMIGDVQPPEVMSISILKNNLDA